MKRIIDAQEPRRPDPIPYGLMAQVRDALGSAVARQIMQVITKLNDDAERLAEEKRLLALQIFSEKCRGRHDPIMAWINVYSDNFGYYVDIKTLIGTFSINGHYRHRKTAMRAARRMVERINRKGIEICHQ